MVNMRYGHAFLFGLEHKQHPIIAKVQTAMSSKAITQGLAKCDGFVVSFLSMVFRIRLRSAEDISGKSTSITLSTYKISQLVIGKLLHYICVRVKFFGLCEAIF